jgi:hypothetical protein
MLSRTEHPRVCVDQRSSLASIGNINNTHVRALFAPRGKKYEEQSHMKWVTGLGERAMLQNECLYGENIIAIYVPTTFPLIFAWVWMNEYLFFHEQ